ncbi:hypothetical protein [Paenibacillus sp. UNC451MF]|nr:hypothetical protein [Paenibacillus sp. UNC451MF]
MEQGASIAYFTSRSRCRDGRKLADGIAISMCMIRTATELT